MRVGGGGGALHMTEFWKSGARHWCTYCKIFINGTKPSIAYHESGKKHKEIVDLLTPEDKEDAGGAIKKGARKR